MLFSPTFPPPFPPHLLQEKGNHHFRVRASSLNRINVVLWIISYQSIAFSLWFGAVTILLCTVCNRSMIGIRESLISGSPTSLRESEIQRQTHHWKELSVLSVSSPSPSLHLSRLSSQSHHFTKTGLSKVTSRFLLTQWNGHFSDIFLHLVPWETVDHSHHSFVCFSPSSFITLYPQRIRFCFFSLFTHNRASQDFNDRILTILRLIDVLYGKHWKSFFFLRGNTYVTLPSTMI